MPAIEDTIAHGISVNVTLIFSLERHRKAAEAYVRGVQRLVDGGRRSEDCRRPWPPSSSRRVDTEADKRLEAIGGQDELLPGKLAIAQRQARRTRTHSRKSSLPEWEALVVKGASKQRCLWASTGVKNPDDKDTVYVDKLVGPDTGHTMPRELVEAVLDHGDIRGNTITEDAKGCVAALLDQVEAAGVSYDDVAQMLEREGVEKFAKSFSDLIEGLERKLKMLVAA